MTVNSFEITTTSNKTIQTGYSTSFSSLDISFVCTDRDSIGTDITQSYVAPMRADSHGICFYLTELHVIGLTIIYGSPNNHVSISNYRAILMCCV